MACIANLSPSHRPPQPSLNNGPVQRRLRRAFVATGQSVLSTTQIMDWSHPRPVPPPVAHGFYEALPRFPLDDPGMGRHTLTVVACSLPPTNSFSVYSTHWSPLSIRMLPTIVQSGRLIETPDQ